MSAIAELRLATWPVHQRLEKRLDVKTRFTEPRAYRAHLEKMWGFCAAIERRLEPHVFGAAVPDYEKRRKIPLLTRDLIALGADAEAVERLPSCETIPDCADPAAAFGCIYVLEGATLGGRTLLPLVQSRLGLTAEGGAAFLASYGDEVASMWRGFGAALDAWCDPPERRVRATHAAVATFTSLDEWLCGKPDGR
jgi:heme oxygenase (biliverdin-IX-beta and delta-forming)